MPPSSQGPLSGVQSRCPTLAHEGLAGVQEDLTALGDHALNGQVFADVLCLADFIMHDPGEIGSKRYAALRSGRGMLSLWADQGEKLGHEAHG